METELYKKPTYTRIESPLVLFNNIQMNITEQFDEIFYPEFHTGCKSGQSFKNTNVAKLVIKNQILFENKSITLFNCFKLVCASSKMYVKVLKPLDAELLKLLGLLSSNEGKIDFLFFQYVSMLEKISKNYDDTISTKFVETLIINLANNRPEAFDKYFQIPHKMKIRRLYDSPEMEETMKRLMDNIFGRYDYAIKFHKEYPTSSTIKFSIVKLLCARLPENLNLESLKFDEIDVISSGTFPSENVQSFVSELMYYGNIVKN